MQSKEPIELGRKAAQDGRVATDCPFEMGKQRRQWLDGYFSVKPRLADDEPEAEEDE
jgi:ribosome modulation factor